MKNSKILCVMVIGFLFVLSSSVYAAPFLPGSETSPLMWTASDPDGRDASALFKSSGGMLNITVTNKAGLTGSNTVPNEVLMGIFFSLGGCTISLRDPLDGPTVEVAVASFLIGGAGTNLDGEYGYRDGIDPATNFGFGEYGVSAASLDPGPGAPAGWIPFGAGTIINPLLSFPNSAAAPNGPDYGMVGSGADFDLAASIDPYVLDSVLMTFSLDGTFAGVEKVTFIYGTSMVPEPATMLLFGTGLIGLAGFRKKFRKQ